MRNVKLGRYYNKVRFPGTVHTFYPYRLLGGGTNFVAGYNAPRGGSTFSVTGLALSLYQPHHIAFVSERYEERIYVDGRLVGSRATGTSIVDHGSNKGCLGGGTFGTGWVGYIDSLRLSDTIRYAGREFIPPLGDMTADGSTLLLYNFNELPGSLTTADSSGNGRTGTLGMGYVSGATSPEFLHWNAFRGSVCTVQRTALPFGQAT
ncbi:MAG: LamG domain-containing protein [Lentisphaerae bacterium]|nr:LamG domain-containing protein [Lentisphaerota bacterium]